MIGIVPAEPGAVKLYVTDGYLVKVELTKEKAELISLPPFTDQFIEYFEGRRKIFDLPYKANFTPFQKKVYGVVSEIPYGVVLTYGEVGVRIDPTRGPKLSRAVGQALKRNPLPVIIPCHRVVGRNSLGGFSPSLDWKEFLIFLEKKYSHCL
ncbi:MAG: methylated-DNA-[protein]-cysteine S-methyltransferase [Thermotogota bacterium]|nr:methylated-DNA-[protein]-cysteine S-methyltransferase [Thermotogota bacterium]MDK2864364.1 methylated-DNA-[protein]-cysteine S-methyltransferase [Thermotogota bacterium]HCZ05925.1 methylated-DNA--[protein]-cysteine S-methyltransferase [Thermotogota bacterium]